MMFLTDVELLCTFLFFIRLEIGILCYIDKTTIAFDYKRTKMFYVDVCIIEHIVNIV